MTRLNLIAVTILIACSNPDRNNFENNPVLPSGSGDL